MAKLRGGNPSSPDPEAILCHLRALEGIEVTLDVLEYSKVGRAVAKLRNHSDEGVASAAVALVLKWKALVRATPSQCPKKLETFYSKSKDGRLGHQN